MVDTECRYSRPETPPSIKGGKQLEQRPSYLCLVGQAFSQVGAAGLGASPTRSRGARDLSKSCAFGLVCWCNGLQSNIEVTMEHEESFAEEAIAIG